MPSTDTRSDETLVSASLNTYRYLRLSIVVLVVALLISVVIERTKVAGCWQGSLSAYYFTPVHAVFVGTLVVVGVSLIAIKGRTLREDMLLNLAGVLAPIVAFVPTKALSHKTCVSTELVFADRTAAVDNNVFSLLLAGGLAIAVLLLVVKLTGSAKGRVAAWAGKGTLFVIGLAVAGSIWYFAYRASFLNNAHGSTAAVMFFVIFIVMVMNRGSATGKYRWMYTMTAAAMALVAVGVGVGKVIDSEWQHHILFIEVLELAVFAVYWVVQTVEHWNDGVSGTSDETLGSRRA